MKTKHPYAAHRASRCLSLILTLAMLVSLFAAMLPTANAADEPAADLTIATLDDLKALAAAVDDGNTYAGKTVVLVADIDASEENWNPIGSCTSSTTFAAFAGTFDGQGHTVTLKIESPAEKYLGLFAYNSGTIRNVTVRGSISGKGYLGGTCGYNAGTISGCTNYATINSTDAWVGGITGCGKASASQIENCSNYGAIETTIASGNAAYAGGIIGQALASTSITACYNAGTVTSNKGYTGGVAGYAMSTIQDCYNVGAVSSSVTGTTKTIGGVAGALMGSGIMTNCYNVGTVTAVNAGAIAGMAYNGKFTNCYYLESSADYGICSLSSVTGKMTADEMKAAAFAATLGSAFKTVENDYPALTWQNPKEPEEVIPDCKVSLKIGISAATFSVPHGKTLNITWQFIDKDGVPYGWQMLVNGEIPTATETIDGVTVIGLPTMATVCTSGKPADVSFTPTKEQCLAGETVMRNVEVTPLTDEACAFDILFVEKATGRQVGQYEENGAGYHASKTYGKFTISATKTTTIANWVTMHLNGYRLYMGTNGNVDRQEQTLLVGENGVEPKCVTMYVEVNHSTLSPLHTQKVQFKDGETIVLETAVPLTHNWTGSYPGAIDTIELDLTAAEEQLTALGYAFDQTQTYTVDCDNYTHDPAVTVIEVTAGCKHLLDINSAEDNEDGTHTAYCWNCGEYITEPHTYDSDGFCTICFAEHNHSYTYEKKSADYHTVGCTGCALAKQERHTWDDGVVTTEPTATATGIKTFTCTACGETRTEVIPSETVPFEYIIQDGAVTITKYIGTVPEIVIPAVIEGKPVTAIGDRAFYNCWLLESVEIGSNVETIGNDAFGFCKALTGIVIPDNVKTIGSEAFARCDALKTVTIGKGVESIGTQAFLWDNALEGFTVSAGNANFCAVDGILFSKDQSELLQYPIGRKDAHFTVPNDVEIIGSYAFAYANLESVMIPDSVLSIEDGAFYYSTVENVTLGKNLISIGDSAFEACSMLGNVTFPDGLVRIGNAAFYQCRAMTAVTIPDSVRTIGNYAFQCCTNVETVVIGYGVEDIGMGAFCGKNFGSDNQMHIKTFTVYNKTVPIDIYTFDFDPNIVLYGFLGSTLQERAGSTMKFVALDCIVNGHKTELKDAKAATCTEAGYTGDEVCTVCGETVKKGEVLAALGHKTELKNAKAATCTEAGYTGDEVCTVCGDTVKKGEVIAALGHKWDDGKVTTEPTAREDGVRTFTCTACGETRTEAIPAIGAEPVDPATIFIDVTHNWAYEGISYCYNNGLMVGLTDTVFGTNDPVTRGQLVTILWRQAGEPKATKTCPFTDLTMNYYRDAIAWAAEVGVAAGRDATHFDPDAAVSRQEMTAFFYRYAENVLDLDMSKTADLSAFPDADSTSNYAKGSMAWAVAEGLISGDKTSDGIILDPLGTATRAQVATVFMNFCEIVLK